MKPKYNCDLCLFSVKECADHGVCQAAAFDKAAEIQDKCDEDQACPTCRWYAPFESVCCNGDSANKKYGGIKMKKAMISQPMNGLTNEQIVNTRNKALSALSAAGYEVVNTLFTDEWYSKESMEGRGVVQIPLCFLAKSLENMSLCHAAYFCKGWENARGCKIEHEVALAYGLEIIYEQ